ncbi:NUDIX hydrolase [Streptomyces sp. TRM66268-LWL]|uniref:NUDIX hydrolase n=1 Tax=Streptomyces polyasparticus TaxID=2767826 RepID=A0ABR7SUE6_9ACTN|nr:NUDIX hydrolase [Streptomyces polyasparticus]MBC9718419.1 NUDIX hydrolase [Streptomyces polyasparticus]
MSGVWLPPEQYIATLPKATVYAALYVTDEAGRPVLLRVARNPKMFQFPGGNLDTEETPWECALRECREETGLTLTLEPRLLLMHYLPPLGSWTVNKIGFIFDGGVLSQDQIDSIVLDPGEHTEVVVHTLDEWRQLQNPASTRRLEAVDRARRTGITCYLEHTPQGDGPTTDTRPMPGPN